MSFRAAGELAAILAFHERRWKDGLRVGNSAIAPCPYMLPPRTESNRPQR